MTDMTMTLTGPDGQTSAPFTLEQMQGVTARMKETAEDVAVKDAATSVAARELRQFVERYERLEAEKKDIADAQKEVMAEAKARGYCTKTLRKIVSIRKCDANDLAEQEAVLDMYKAALGM